MKILQNQDGISHILALIGVLVIAVAGFAGYRVMQSNNDAVPGASDSITQSTKEPDTLKTKEDLEKANSSLDSLTVDDSVNPDQLDQDIDALL